jgi:hypothetical protein
MKQPVVIVGLGELGSVFARAFLKSGFPVYPVTRKMDISVVVDQVEDPDFVLAAVGENDLPQVLKSLPEKWRDKIGMLQNELLPFVWKAGGIQNPTVISVWFEKKKGQDFNVFIPSPVYGPHAELISDVLGKLDIPCRLLVDENELVFYLAVKNVYVLTINIAGLETGGTVGELWSNHNELARRVANEVIDLQECLTERVFEREKLIESMIEGINGEPKHQCRGRSSLERLSRVIALADRHGLKISTIREIHTLQTV